MSPVQGHVACRNLPLTGPHYLLGEVYVTRGDERGVVFVRRVEILIRKLKWIPKEHQSGCDSNFIWPLKDTILRQPDNDNEANENANKYARNVVRPTFCSIFVFPTWHLWSHWTAVPWVRKVSGTQEVKGSNPIQAWIFPGFLSQLRKTVSKMRWSSFI